MAEGPPVAGADEIDEIDEIAEALGEDPVLLDPIFGNGHTEQVHDALNELIDDLDFPAYVVMGPRPEGLSASDPDRELATLLHNRIGGDAVFVVRTDPKSHHSALVTFGDVPEERLIGIVNSSNAPDGGAYGGVAPVGIAARDLEILGSGGDMTADEFDSYTEEVIWREPADWDAGHEVPGEGFYAVYTTMAFVVAAGCAWLLLRNAARWRETAPSAPRAVTASKKKASGKKAASGKKPVAVKQASEPPEQGPVEVRAQVERELDDLAARLATTADTQQPAETRVLVDGSYDTARTVLERVGTAAGDLDDLVGALVLVRVAARALTTQPQTTQGQTSQAQTTQGRGRPYRPCFFDPRHGEGTLVRTVAVGDRDLEVPACKGCARRAEGSLAPMRVARGPVAGLVGRAKPWYEHDTVWARTGYGAFVDDLWQHVATAQREAR